MNDKEILFRLGMFLHFNALMVMVLSFRVVAPILGVSGMMLGNIVIMGLFLARYGTVPGCFKNFEWSRKFQLLILTIVAPSMVVVELRKVLSPSWGMLLIFCISLIQWRVYRRIAFG
jgi:hypothetical protein